MRRNRGWKFHLLTEDLEFTMDSILHGDRIGYCGTAMLYDEQPVTFQQSWRQRLRWSKGFLQVFRYYGMALIKRAVRERDFSSVDFTLLLCPFTVLGVIRIVLGLLFVAFGTQFYVLVVLHLVVVHLSARYLYGAVSYVVDECAVVAHKHNGFCALLQESLEPADTLYVEVVGRIVEQ